MSLYLDVGPNDVIQIGSAFVTLERKSGQRARLRIIGPSKVELLRNAKHLEKSGPQQEPLNPPATETGD